MSFEHRTVYEILNTLRRQMAIEKVYLSINIIVIIILICLMVFFDLTGLKPDNSNTIIYQKVFWVIYIIIGTTLLLFHVYMLYIFWSMGQYYLGLLKYSSKFNYRKYKHIMIFVAFVISIVNFK